MYGFLTVLDYSSFGKHMLSIKTQGLIQSSLKILKVFNNIVLHIHLPTKTITVKDPSHDQMSLDTFQNENKNQG